MIDRGLTLSGVRLGEHDRRTFIDCEDRNCSRTYDVPIQNLIPHPNYTLSSSIHDIALLRLKYSISFSTSIRPICLPPMQFRNKNFDEFPLTVVGWGENENGKKTQPKFFD